MKPLIVALDVETDKEALRLARQLVSWVDLFKVGPILFLKYGGAFIQELRGLGVEIFLDLKFHDIPSVVQRSVERVAEWGVYSATLHTFGGLEMLKQAVALKKRPRLWGVTVLTSLGPSELRALGFHRPLPAQVNHLAHLASEAGLDGVVASVGEARDIKRNFGSQLTVVTPGIRLESSADDQKRTQTPAEARRSGADFFVMGRPILEAKDPVHVVKSIYDSLEILI